MSAIKISNSSSWAALANLSSQGGLGVIQIASIPLCISFWGSDTYGTWLLLYGLVGIFSVLDGGIIGIAGTKLLLALSRTRRGDAGDALFLGTTALATVLLFLALIFAGSCMLPKELLPEYLQPFWTRLGLFTYVGAVFSYLLIAGYMQGIGGVATAAWFGAITTLLEASMVPISAIAGYAVSQTIWLLAITRILALALIMTGYYPALSDLKRGGQLARSNRYGLLVLLGGLRAGGSALFVNVAITLQLQLPLWALGASIGPTAVTLYSSIRTITRVSLQVGLSLVKAFAPKYARLVTNGNVKSSVRLKRTLLLYSIVVMTPMAAIIFFAGDNVRSVLHLGASADHCRPEVLLIIALSAIFNFIWMTEYLLQLSLLKHEYISIAIASMTALGSIAFNLFSGDVLNVAICAMLVDAAICAALALPYALKSKKFRHTRSIL